MKHLSLGALIGVASLSLLGCGVPLSNAPPGTAAAIAADATLPPPAALSPLAQTQIDDRAITAAFRALDLAATAADTVLMLKPSFAGTPAARRLADRLVATKGFLRAASLAQRAQQADSYVTALRQATQAMGEAQAALFAIGGAK